jgi:adenine-specific DNA-methyltransferase
MSSRISYMGTKHELAHDVARVIAECRPGRLLDAFAGMGAVAEAHVGKRQVWTNDVQHFAHLASSCRFTDPDDPVSATQMRRLVSPLFRQNLGRLREQNSRAWSATLKSKRAARYNEFQRALDAVSGQAVSHQEAYGCFTRLYSNAYFSFIQCAEIDSIRGALDNLRGFGIITSRQFDWALLALGRSALRVANTTGHFAQYLTPSEKNFKRVAQQFARSVFGEWLSDLTAIRPLGTSQWRQSNTATRASCDSLLRGLGKSSGVSVVYCDPPYTDDQYSRFYHVWETLVLYDYPSVTGKGLYRPGRFTTDFSLRSKVADAFRALVAEVASTGADLVLSYPSNGLLHDAGCCPLELLRAAYPTAQVAAEIGHRHSTMGASKGAAQSAVVERIYLARA